MLLFLHSWHFKCDLYKQKYLYRQSYCSKTWHKKCLAPIAQMVRTFGTNPNIFCLKISTLARTSVRGSKINACAQLKFQVLILYPPPPPPPPSIFLYTHKHTHTNTHTPLPTLLCFPRVSPWRRGKWMVLWSLSESLADLHDRILCSSGSRASP